MDRHSIIFVTDERQRHLADILGNRKTDIKPGDLERTREIAASAEWVILPTPAKKIMGNEMFEQILGMWTPEQKICGGKLPEELKEELRQRKIPFMDLMEDEIVTEKNAKVTAEAVVAETIIHSTRAVEGQKIVITGFGRCARHAAEKLSALGAQITILARNRDQRKEARLLGYCAADFAYGPEEVRGAGIIINTVPAPVVTERLYSHMSPQTLVLDIASAPGGCDQEAAKRYGVKTLLLPGLPGRYVTATGAGILADAIRRKWNLQTGRREEKTWIFQVLQ